MINPWTAIWSREENISVNSLAVTMMRIISGELGLWLLPRDQTVVFTMPTDSKTKQDVTCSMLIVCPNIHVVRVRVRDMNNLNCGAMSCGCSKVFRHRLVVMHVFFGLNKNNSAFKI